MRLREIVDLFADLVGIDTKELARSDQALGDFALITWRAGHSLQSIAYEVPGKIGRFSQVDRLRREALARERSDSGYRAGLEQLTAELAFRVEARALESLRRSRLQENRGRFKKRSNLRPTLPVSDVKRSGQQR